MGRVADGIGFCMYFMPQARGLSNKDDEDDTPRSMQPLQATRKMVASGSLSLLVCSIGISNRIPRVIQASYTHTHDNSAPDTTYQPPNALAD